MKYEQSQQQDVIRLQQNKGNKQISENEQTIQGYRQDLQALQYEIEVKKRQLQAQNDVIALNRSLVLAKEQEVQSLQHEIEAMKYQLRKLNQQLESNEETTAILKNTITQRDKEIAELREIPATLQHTITQQDGEIVELRELLQHSRVEASQGPINMSWESLSFSATYLFAPISAVVGDKVYLLSLPISNTWQFVLTLGQWKIVCKHPLRHFSLVNISNELTTVGGCSGSWRTTDSDKLYCYIKGQWVETYPPMPTKRCKCASVYSRNVLIVAGGQQHIEGSKVPSSAVEILNIAHMQWSQLLPLTFSNSWPSISICGEFVYVSTGSKWYSIAWCSLFSSSNLSPGSRAGDWEEIAPLPVENFTLITIKGQLLALGGKSITEKKSIRDIRQYNSNTNSWQVISQMNVARSDCAAAILPDNKLIVVGGTSKKEPIEVALIF